MFEVQRVARVSCSDPSEPGAGRAVVVEESDIGWDRGLVLEAPSLPSLLVA